MKKYSFKVPRILIIPMLLFLIIFAVIWFKAASDQPLFLILGALILISGFGTGIYTLITGREPYTITEDQSIHQEPKNNHLTLIIAIIVTFLISSGGVFAWQQMVIKSFKTKAGETIYNLEKEYSQKLELEKAGESLPTYPQMFSDFLISPAGNYVAVTENKDMSGYFDGNLIFYSNKGKEMKKITLYELKNLWVKENLDNLFIIGLDQWSNDGSVLTGSLVNGYGFLGMSYQFQINTKDWSIKKVDLTNEKNNSSCISDNDCVLIGSCFDCWPGAINKLFYKAPDCKKENPDNLVTGHYCGNVEFKAVCQNNKCKADVITK